MAYRLRYQAYVDWVPAGVGLGQQTAANLGAAPAGNAQTIEFFNTIPTPATSATFTAPDITALLLAMATDLSAQMNVAATLARIQAFSSGQG